MNIKIMTYNIQHCNAHLRGVIDYDLIASAIAREGADIVGLNEVYGDGGGEISQAKILADAVGYPYFYFAKAIELRGGRGYGNAILSKYPISSAQTIAVPDPDPDRRSYGGHYESRVLLKADITTPSANRLTVGVIHFGLNPDEAENAVKTVIKELPHERSLLIGDLNLTPDSKILDPIRMRMKDTQTMAPTFPSDAPRTKIDHIFMTPDIKLISHDTPPTVASDHLPHTANIEI